jgi:hypothetical protein
MKETKKGILLGFEIGTGNPVYFTLHHLVITGMTQLSGKTTTLEALIHRSGLKAIAFITKRGEVGFQQYNELLPYFKERSDWQYVESLIEATMREDQRFNRSWIVKACRGTRSLKDVFSNVEEAREKARKDSLTESVYTNLAEYLKIVIPQIEKFQFSSQILLKEGINVMDLSEMSLEMRCLVIRSVMEYALEILSGTIVIIPEAWEYLPQFRSTPVKYYAEAFIRKGASVGNYLWVDSQDIAGIDKTALRQCDNWILGRQKDAREVNRTREEIFKNTPTEQEIMTLKLGEFYACLGNEVYKVYVQPSWLSEQVAKDVAIGKIPVEDIQQGHLIAKTLDSASDRILWKERFELAERKNQELEQTVNALRQQNEEMREANLDKYHQEVEQLQKRLQWTEKSLTDARNEIKGLEPLKKLQEALISILPANTSHAQPLVGQTVLNLEQSEMVVNVAHKEETVEMKTTNQQGQIMYVAINEMPKEGFTEAQISEALKEHGWNIAHGSIAPQLNLNLPKQGLLIKMDGKPNKYRLPTKVKINVAKQDA